MLLNKTQVLEHRCWKLQMCFRSMLNEHRFLKENSYSGIELHGIASFQKFLLQPVCQVVQLPSKVHEGGHHLTDIASRWSAGTVPCLKLLGKFMSGVLVCWTWTTYHIACICQICTALNQDMKRSIKHILTIFKRDNITDCRLYVVGWSNTFPPFTGFVKHF